MISTFSKTFDKCQSNYSVTDKELLGVIKGIENYRHYLLGRPFILRTDHKALVYLWNNKNSNCRILRWALKLQEYSFKIEHIKGTDNIEDGPAGTQPIESGPTKLRQNTRDKKRRNTHSGPRRARARIG
ncbi:Retrovirus-related Pol polyprotein from transposon [Nosema granulosis]|uniref:Retrovirus-related Pol polyprotein from transposon n=1 Tax=Nosema granulosis TaxID=83296 RepID=A0A9P6KY99_9MICR|nr:Retrovirus-related Pol polyprotein from transposon [Nosema granulosis]